MKTLYRLFALMSIAVLLFTGGQKAVAADKDDNLPGWLFPGRNNKENLE